MMLSIAAKAPTALAARRGARHVPVSYTVQRGLVGFRGRSPVSVCSTGGDNPELKIGIEGMMCDGCSSRIEKVLKGMESVKTVSVSLEGKVAVVGLAKEAANSAEAQAAAAALVDTINSLGFEAKLQQ
ncbi:hypothetical protein PLESTB_001736200 [Pleodorina starrii]|uniref:HMA domain-containing protein n=1 Tax=Pleodorina starrii TaxID=330485 RepID=A0A9W6BZR4_9CHLO|nr:hypothetical protein PLESTM_000744200 [Pleodorina starrii]GLC61253.1 hypothetical protein PLESTB_001736200 [Pleodorina starrii]GLC74741.1 hypothetical protein PLESTF_001550400 [Pleodorina starrii]